MPLQNQVVGLVEQVVQVSLLQEHLQVQKYLLKDLLQMKLQLLIVVHVKLHNLKHLQH